LRSARANRAQRPGKREAHRPCIRHFSAPARHQRYIKPCRPGRYRYRVRASARHEDRGHERGGTLPFSGKACEVVAGLARTARVCCAWAQTRLPPDCPWWRGSRAPKRYRRRSAHGRGRPVARSGRLCRGFAPSLLITSSRRPGRLRSGGSPRMAAGTRARIYQLQRS